MRKVLAEIRNHWRGHARYDIEEQLRPEFISAAASVDVDRERRIRRVMLNSVSYGVAEWHAGKGLVTCLRWENEEESKRGGGWAGLLSAQLARGADDQHAERIAFDALARLPLQATKFVLVEFLAKAAEGGIDFPEAAVDEFRTLAMAGPASAPNA